MPALAPEPTIDRSSWGQGPWDGEPDRLEFKHDGLQCLILRVPEMGHLCGYVGVPEGHLLHGVGYGDSSEALRERLAERMDEPLGNSAGIGLMLACLAGRGDTPTPETALRVHGGITYAAECAGRICHVPEPGEPDKLWWFGFDCAHCDDYQPGNAALWVRMGKPELADRLGTPTGPGRTLEYRTVDYVRRECESLADQLAALGKEPN